MPPKKAVSYKGRVVFLHGYTQSSSIFYAKLSALRKKLQKLGYKAVYLNGPCKLTAAQLPSSDALSKFNTVVSEDEDLNYRAWWTKKHVTNTEVDLTASVDAVRDYIENGTIIPDPDQKDDYEEGDKELPILGLVGFSQGASMAGLLTHKFGELFGSKTLKFAVLYSGFKLDTSKGSGNEQYDSYYPKDSGEGDGIRYLHVYGELDTVVADDRALTFYNVVKKSSDLLKHPGGHFVPNSKLLIDQVTNWIQHADSDEVEEKKEVDEDDLDALMDMMDNLGKA